ncbi:MAG: hypothetical protein WC438_01215 [Candidatus Pacearchaeota archaeon]
METQETKQRREKLRKHLSGLVIAAESINSIMKEIPHRNSSATRCLNPGSEEYIQHINPSSFVGFYKDENGHSYEITISRRKK